LKAIVYKYKNTVKQEEIPKPELKQNGAIVKIKGCGLCGSDIVKLKQGLFKKNAVPGHEIVGHIEEIKGNDKFKPGDRVVLGHHVPCFKCVYCKNENYSMCPEFRQSNIVPGGFAEYIFVSEKHLEHTVFKVPDHVTDTDASFTEPVACCLRAVKRSAVKHGDRVQVIGLGSIGIIMGQILKHFGAEVHGYDLIRERNELARNLGIEPGIIENADRVFLTAGSTSTINIALNTVRDGGTVLVFASIPSDETGFANNDIYYRELTVLGSYSPSPQDLGEALELISKNLVKVDNLFDVYDMIDVEKAINDTVANNIIKAFIQL